MKIVKHTISIIIVAVLIVCCPLFSFAQTPVGIGTIAPDSKSMLHINSTTKGVFIPKLSTTQQTTLAATLNLTHKGLMVTDSASGNTLYWNGIAWKNFDPTVITTITPLSVVSDNTVAFNPGTTVGDLITWDGNNWINQQPAVQHFNIAASNVQPYTALNFCIALVGIFPSRNGIDPFIGQLGLYSFSFAPKYWAQCNGQLLSIAQNQALFSLLGTQYGGNGQTTFALPDLRGRTPIHYGGGAGLSLYNIGDRAGQENNFITR